MNVRLTHIDGKLPNLALMKLAHWHRARGDDVFLQRKIVPGLFEPDYKCVYGSTIFEFSQKITDEFRRQWPQAVISGTGTGSVHQNVEELVGGEYEKYDYSVYPDFQWSIGFTQRGCRLRCKFCVVPQKEGKPRSVNTIYDIWRRGTERNIILLDNDFFGQDKAAWRERLAEIGEGGFRVNFNQGINIRLIDEEAAQGISQIPYYDAQFRTRRLYTAWDNLKDEEIFTRGVECLRTAGIPSRHLMVYMLIGFDPLETWERILYRHQRMRELGVMCYPMVYNNARKDLKRFQRWVIRRFDQFIPWEKFRGSHADAL